jgi:DNA-binding response OmpR family regulator
MMRAVRRILIVDDDGGLRQSLAEQLELHEEFASVECGTAAQALEMAKSERFDAILLDVGLPDMDGRELCRLLRRAGVQVPIVMLTGADSDADAVLGLDSGADDYVTKPFRLSVLLARLRAHLRQSEHSDDAVFTIGPYTFRPSAKLLLDPSGRKKVRLTEKETAILKYLYRAGDQAIGRDTLLGEVWGYNAGVTTHTLETHVYRLRQKIERDPARAEILVTEPGGYRLVP